MFGGGFATGLSIAASAIGGTYLSTTSQVAGQNLMQGQGRFGSSLSGSFLNYINPTLFGDTTVGSTLGNLADKYLPDFMTNPATLAAAGKAGLTIADEFFQGDPNAPGGMPDKGGIRATPVRGMQLSAATKTPYTPMGRNGKATQAFESASVQQILASELGVVPIPRSNVVNPTLNISAGKVTTASPKLSKRSTTKMTKYSSKDKD